MSGPRPIVQAQITNQIRPKTGCPTANSKPTFVGLSCTTEAHAQPSSPARLFSRRAVLIGPGLPAFSLLQHNSPAAFFFQTSSRAWLGPYACLSALQTKKQRQQQTPAASRLQWHVLASLTQLLHVAPSHLQSVFLLQQLATDQLPSYVRKTRPSC